MAYTIEYRFLCINSTNIIVLCKVKSSLLCSGINIDVVNIPSFYKFFDFFGVLLCSTLGIEVFGLLSSIYPRPNHKRFTHIAVGSLKPTSTPQDIHATSVELRQVFDLFFKVKFPDLTFISIKISFVLLA